MDLLSDWLRVVETRTVLLASTRLSSPWGFKVPAKAGPMFHIVTAGAAWLRVGTEKLRLEAGDLVLLPAGTAHELADGATTRAVPLDVLLARQSQPEAPSTHSVVCGALEGDSVHPLIPLRALPRILHLSHRRILESGDLHATLQLLRREVEHPGPGSELLLPALLQALLLYLLREWGKTACSGASWVVGIGDPELSSALAAIHAEPGKPWSLESLAQESGMSRAALARRFHASLGMAPMEYLRAWRMNVAARMLREERVSVSEVARRLAYDSEFSFSRAFKRVLGHPPSRYRTGNAPRRSPPT